MFWDGWNHCSFKVMLICKLFISSLIFLYILIVINFLNFFNWGKSRFPPKNVYNIDHRTQFIHLFCYIESLEPTTDAIVYQWKDNKVTILPLSWKRNTKTKSLNVFPLIFDCLRFRFLQSFEPIKVKLD